MEAVVKQLLMYHKPPCEDWLWFASPKINIALALPETWIMIYPPEMNEWVVRHKRDEDWENGGPQVRGIIDVIPGGPAKVRKNLHFINSNRKKMIP